MPEKMTKAQQAQLVKDSMAKARAASRLRKNEKLRAKDKSSSSCVILRSGRKVCIGPTGSKSPSINLGRGRSRKKRARKRRSQKKRARKRRSRKRISRKKRSRKRRSC